MEIAFFTDTLNDKPTGIGNYTCNLIRSLVKTDNTDKYSLINSQKTSLFSDINEIIIQDPFRHISKALLWQLYATTRLRKFDNIDIVHNCTHNLTFFKLAQKSVVTVHDISPISMSYTHARGYAFLFRLLFPNTLRKADSIVTDSVSTQNEVAKYLNIPLSNMTVVYPGIDHDVFHMLPRNDVHGVIENYGLNSPFILYVGTLEPRKNVAGLIEAFHKLSKKQSNYKLVLAGKKGWLFDRIFKIVEALDIQDKVIFMDYVPEKDLPILYNAAELFVYPSLYEGFGLPPLEAMACGAPVITSNTSSLPEVVGDAGITVDPHDIDRLADEMLRVLADEGLRQDMINKGLDRAKMFNWKKTAGETINVYRNICGKSA